MAKRAVLQWIPRRRNLWGISGIAGREWRPTKKAGPRRCVFTISWTRRRKERLIPYGVYDMGRNMGWVSVGIDHDTATFAVATIRRWWRYMGRKSYPKARSLLITADPVAAAMEIAFTSVEVGTSTAR